MVAVGLFSFGFPAADSLLETWGVISLITLRNLLGLLFLVGLMAFKLSVSSLAQLPWIKGFWHGPQPELNHPTQFGACAAKAHLVRKVVLSDKV